MVRERFVVAPEGTVVRGRERERFGGRVACAARAVGVVAGYLFGAGGKVEGKAANEGGYLVIVAAAVAFAVVVAVASVVVVVAAFVVFAAIGAHGVEVEGCGGVMEVFGLTGFACSAYFVVVAADTVVEVVVGSCHLS